MTPIQAPAPGVLDLAADKEKIASFLAHQVETGKQKHDPDQHAEMEAYLYSEEYPADLERLQKGDYFFSAPFHYRIAKNASGKKRDVYALKGRDLYILRMVSWILHDYDSTMFPPGLYSFRRNEHAKDFLKKIRSFHNLDRFWIIKTDVSNYVGSIVPEKIIPRLEEMWPNDPALLGLLKFLLLRRECIEPDGSVVACEPGGLGGLPVANYFMNVYLMEMDWYFNMRSPLYCRYSDDIVILARDREEAEAYLKKFYGILDEKQLMDYLALCRELGLSALVEAHKEAEIETALRAGAEIIGVNNRNLHDFTVDTENSRRLRRLIPSDILFVSESGVKNAEDVQRLREIGADAVLVGETMMRAEDKASKLQELRGET